MNDLKPMPTRHTAEVSFGDETMRIWWCGDDAVVESRTVVCDRGVWLVMEAVHPTEGVVASSIRLVPWPADVPSEPCLPTSETSLVESTSGRTPVQKTPRWRRAFSGET